MNNTAYIIVTVFVCIAVVIRFSIRFYFIHKDCKNEASKPFVCPECGHKFYVTPRAMLYRRNYRTILLQNNAYLKCPNCNKSSRCQRPYDVE